MTVLTSFEIPLATPVDIDTALAEIHGDVYKLRAQARAAWDSLETSVSHYLCLPIVRSRRQKPTREQVAETLRELTELRDVANHPLWKTRAGDRARSILRSFDTYGLREEQADSRLTDAQPYDEEFTRRGGWNRFFLVQGGHIHRSLHCPTCRPTTQIGWLPLLSGQTEEEAVAAYGAVLCTVCWPSAPVEWTRGVDDGKCSGQPDWDKPHRTGYYTGNWATCGTCGATATFLRSGKLRKHDRKTEEEK